MKMLLLNHGRTYGIELLAQQKLQSNFYGIMSLTYYKSEFKDKNDLYVPSSWDNRFILNLTAGKKFNRNIEIDVNLDFLVEHILQLIL